MEHEIPKESSPHHSRHPPAVSTARSRSIEEPDVETQSGSILWAPFRNLGSGSKRSEKSENKALIQELQGKIDKQQQMIQQLHSQVISLNSQLEGMRWTVESQEAQVRQAQARAFENMDGDTWTVGDDGTVRADLENLHSRIKSWAKKHALEDMGSVDKLAPDEFTKLSTLLTGVVRLCAADPSREPSVVLGHLQTTSMKKKSPAMCLQALLAHHVYRNIIALPFFVLDDRNETLWRIYEELQRVNQKEAHIWRSKMLRLLATPPIADGGHAKPEDDMSRYNVHQEAICYNLAGKFWDGPAKHLIKAPISKEEDDQTMQDLASIVQHAGELSSRLWSRRTTLLVLGLSELKDEPFSTHSDHMKAHALHRLYDDDDKCDGWLANIVLHPAVLGFGSSDGEDYRTPRVWMKAEVWLKAAPNEGEK
ncbi:hypothetical protein ACQKWADRAFT_302174 [Trichoderma austrokoningii]